MRKLTQTTTKLITIIAIAVMTTSCGGFFGFDITDQSGIDSNLRSKIGAAIGENAQVIELNLSQGSSGTFSKTIDAAYVHYFPEGSDELKHTRITLGGKSEGKDVTVSHTFKNMSGEWTVKPSDAIKLSEMDFSKIASNVAKAEEMVIAEKGEFSGIDGYTIKANSDAKQVIHTFKIQSREDSKTTTKNGRLATEISYIEFSFEADSEGNVKSIKD